MVTLDVPCPQEYLRFGPRNGILKIVSSFLFFVLIGEDCIFDWAILAKDCVREYI